MDPNLLLLIDVGSQTPSYADTNKVSMIDVTISFQERS